jgi:predicted alpha/beta superfamily hydrolase
MPSVPAPERGYSTVIAFDGNATFPILWKAREATAPDAPVVVVGVGYDTDMMFDMPKRWFDLTTPHTVRPGAAPARGPGDNATGGRDAMLTVLVDRILPALSARFPLDTSNMTLYGHSLGGLFALHTLFTRPCLFNKYAAADPSMWWNSGDIVPEAAAFLGGVAAGGGRIEPPIVLDVTASGGWARHTMHGAAPHDVVRLVKESGVTGLKATFDAFEDDTHGSLIAKSVERTLRLHLG